MFGPIVSDTLSKCGSGRAGLRSAGRHAAIALGIGAVKEVLKLSLVFHSLTHEEPAPVDGKTPPDEEVGKHQLEEAH